MNLTKSKWRLSCLGLCLALSCAGRVAPDPDREALFAMVTNGSIQRAHPCQAARDAEVSLDNGFLPESVASAVRAKIDQAELGDVQRCLAQARAYNDCFLALSCDALAAGPMPAWLLGSERAPCACGVGVEHEHQPFANSALPATLSACTELLPVSRAPASPGESGECPQ